jgi:SAM-dependent methyltransferase
MLDWTGERFVPWAKEAAVAYEHLHRYMWASTLVRGKRVLDLASGEGYGSNLMAGQAAEVYGVDIDEAAVRHASEKYSRSNLHFLKGSITDVPVSGSGTFDVIVCFEAIEHIEEHDALLGEVKRLLKPDGLFIVSTPNKEIHDASDELSNPFHVKELNFDEFNALLSKHFSRVSYLGQRLHPASSLWPIGSSNGRAIQEFVVERGKAEFSEIRDNKRVPRYFVGIASNASAIDQPGSVLLDHSDELTDLLRAKDLDLRAKDLDLRETKASANTAKEWLEEQLDERNEALVRRGAEVERLNKDVEGLQKSVDESQKGVEELNKGLAWLQARNKDLEGTISSRDEALAWRAEQVDGLEKAKTELLNSLQTQADRLQSVSGELGLRNQELAEIHMSRGWKVIMKLRAMRDTLKRVLGG